MARFIGYTPTTTADTAFTGGTQSVSTLIAIAENIRKGNTGTANGIWTLSDVARLKKSSDWPGSGTTAAISPTNSGANLTVNGGLLHNYDYVRFQGDQTLSSFSSGSWFPGTENGSLVVVNGNMTINGGVTFQPSNRKKFIFIYVYGNLTLNGTINMSQRGPFHSGQAGANMLIATGTYSSVPNPTIPNSGGGSGGNTCGNGGSTGGPSNNRLGATSTSFAGGAGGAGGGDGQSAGAPQAQGGRGGNAAGSTGGVRGYGGGAGNPGGSGRSEQSSAGSTGIGGVVMIYCTGTFSGSGSIISQGARGGYGRNIHGASSGGGAITVLCNTNSFTGSVSSPAGPPAQGGDPGTGPQGQAGVARILTGASAP